jgi:hypothetical protein
MMRLFYPMPRCLFDANFNLIQEITTPLLYFASFEVERYTSAYFALEKKPEY